MCVALKRTDLDGSERSADVNNEKIVTTSEVLPPTRNRSITPRKHSAAMTDDICNGRTIVVVI